MKSYTDREANAGNGKWIAFLNESRFHQALDFRVQRCTGNCQARRAAQA
jgi:hypothetical protein